MDDETARATLARLAQVTRRRAATDDGQSDRPPVGDADDSYRETIERATEALDDLEAAAAFCEAVGVDELELAAGRAERSMSGCASEGRSALAAFREFRSAAAGDQFRSGHGTSIGGDDVAAPR